MMCKKGMVSGEEGATQAHMGTFFFCCCGEARVMLLSICRFVLSINV